MTESDFLQSETQKRSHSSFSSAPIVFLAVLTTRVNRVVSVSNCHCVRFPYRVTIEGENALSN